jgi:hypothetical protein
MMRETTSERIRKSDTIECGKNRTQNKKKMLFMGRSEIP